LTQAYQRRDRVALLAFHGEGVETVLAPARGLGRTRRALEKLPVGGTTPLAAGLEAACRLVRAERRRRPRQPIWTVLLTDGRANVGAPEAIHRRARDLAALGTECLVVDTETGAVRLGRAAALARVLEATCLPLKSVLGRPLPDPAAHAG
jgi:magnesium chelatase subunit D